MTKKLLLCVSLVLSLSLQAQKDELKTLRKIYEKETITTKDVDTYKAMVSQLKPLAKEESDLIYAKFYEVMIPTVELATKGPNATLQDLAKVFTKDYILQYGTVINETIDFETKTGKKIHSEDLLKEKADFKMQLNTMGFDAFNSNNYLMAAQLFESLYLFDKKNEGMMLENACSAAVNAKDYKEAERLYEIFLDSDYFKNGVKYYATNIANGQENSFNSADERNRNITMGLYEKPRQEKVSNKKKDVLKTLVILTAVNGNNVKAKKYIDEFMLLNYDDQEVKNEGNRIYFNEAYELLTEDDAIVKEMNQNLDQKNKKKYDELNQKRKDLFSKVLPLLEKAYFFNPNEKNTASILKLTYEVLDMKDKAKSLE